MDDLETVKNLLAAGKYPEAGRLLNRLLQKNRDNDELWYFLEWGSAAVSGSHDLELEHILVGEWVPCQSTPSLRLVKAALY